MTRSLVKTRQWTRLACIHQLFSVVLVTHTDGIWSEISIGTERGLRSMKSTDLGAAVDALFELLVREGLIPPVVPA